MFFFSKKSFGLDISDTSLKMVWLDDQGHIRSWNEVGVEPGLMERGVIKDKKKVIVAIKKLLSSPKGKKLGTKKVIACLPETKTFIKVIEVPETTEEKKTEQFILEGIGYHFPLKVEEVYVDWQFVNEKVLSEGLVKVMVGVAPREIVDDYLEILAGAGLQVESLQIEAGAIVNALILEKKSGQKEDDSPKMIIDLGANRSSLILYDKGAIKFSISIPVSGVGITEEIAKSLDFSPAKAEERKIKSGLEDKNSKEYKIIERNFAVIAKVIRQAMKFEGQREGEEARELILCGGVAQTKGAQEYLEEKTKIKVVLGNPFSNIKPEKKQHLKFSGSPISFATAIGLALYGHKLK